MIRDKASLAGYIQGRLQTGESCHIFCHVISACWENVPLDERPSAIADFAAKHGWKVKVHEPAAYGVVAEFSVDSSDAGARGPRPMDADRY